MVPAAYNYSDQHSSPGSLSTTDFSNYLRHHLRMQCYSFTLQIFIGHLLFASHCAGSQAVMVSTRGKAMDALRSQCSRNPGGATLRPGEPWH